MDNFLMMGTRRLRQAWDDTGQWARVAWDTQPPYPELPNDDSGKPAPLEPSSLPNWGGLSPPPLNSAEFVSEETTNETINTFFEMSSQEIADNLKNGIETGDYSELNVRNDEGWGNWSVSKHWSGQYRINRDSHKSHEVLIYTGSGWYSYAGSSYEYCDFFARWRWAVWVYDRVRAEPWTCDQGEPTLDPNWYEIGERCPPPGGGGGGSGGGNGGGGGSLPNTRNSIRKRPKGRRDKKMSCCDCATIADINEAYFQKHLDLYNQQNKYINKRLDDNTDFIRQQIIAATPSGFDYSPILNKIEDARNDLWNGLRQ